VSKNDCVFCKIVRGEMESEVVREVAKKFRVVKSGYGTRINNGSDAGQEVLPPARTGAGW
jgi:diadenosine tetraphosphate (Ap4A) HIT family hydrolase